MGVYALLDWVRARALVRAGVRFDEALSAPLFRSTLKHAFKHRGNDAPQMLRDMDQIREFWTGAGLLTLCDAPFSPVFVFVCFLIHPDLGIVALAGVLVLFLCALANELLTRNSQKTAQHVGETATAYALSTFRNAEAVQALGMQSAIFDRWSNTHQRKIGWLLRASDRGGIVMAFTKFFRQLLQVAILGVGAWLVIRRELSPGLMIAASIMMGRGLAPIEQAVGQWKSFIAARTAWKRLDTLFKELPDAASGRQPQELTGAVAVEGLTLSAPGRERAIVDGVGFSIAPGECLAIIGPNAAGKSTLARAIVGVWPVAQGRILIDGVDLHSLDRHWLGQRIGYLPQSVELFAGSITENIGRFTQADPADVVEAAEIAGAHTMIQMLPNGYDTQIGEAGAVLSGGQRQRVGLARALYGRPKLVVLDEPNANLDSAGEEALAGALRRLKEQQATVVIVTHKPALLPLTDKLLVLEAGRIKKLGPTEAVVNELKSERMAELARQGVIRPSEPIPTEEPAVNPVAAAEQSGIDQEQTARRAEAERRAALHAPGTEAAGTAGTNQKREAGR
jgi:PrtD family type I secretion system ABC transporter